MRLDFIDCGNCVDLMRDLPNECIDLTVTSPPYDNLRKYNGFDFDYISVIKELHRITKQNGVVVWVVGDATINGSETGTSFKEALAFMDTGFKLHDTMIYEKNSSTFPARKNSNRYTQIFEYMIVFSKGIPKAHLICDKKNKYAGWKDFSGKLKNPVPDFSPRTNIWKYTTSFNDKTSHPAVFPEKLAEDHILTWSEEGDVVFDPFVGSGTTAKMAMLNNRHYIGFDISQEYCEIASERVLKYAS